MDPSKYTQLLEHLKKCESLEGFDLAAELFKFHHDIAGHISDIYVETFKLMAKDSAVYPEAIQEDPELLESVKKQFVRSILFQRNLELNRIYGTNAQLGEKQLKDWVLCFCKSKHLV